MSFPPRPPMGMMGAGMMPQGYHGFPPMGMMPMGMGMMQMQMRPQPVHPMSNNNVQQKAPRKLIPQEIPGKIDKKDEKPPVTTVFVGNISERAPDAMVRQILQRCGNVLSWKRVQGASGKLQAFGFCEYEDPEATLRCIRLLNEWDIAYKKLVVKVDAKTKTILDDYKRQKRENEQQNEQQNKKEDKDKEEKSDDEKGGEGKKEGKGEDGTREEGEEVDEDEDEKYLDEFIMREDRVATAGLDAIMREYAVDLAKAPPLSNATKAREKKKEEKKLKDKEPIKDAGLDDMELEEDQKNLINREIKSFRDAHKGEDDREKERERERELRRRREEERERDRERENEKRKQERERDRERERERERERKERERIKQLQREKPRSPSRSRSPEPDRNRERDSRARDHERQHELDDEEEAYDRRKLERKLREKEAAYQELLNQWEARERKKAREYEKTKDREDERRGEEVKEARRLKEFLEDYDDERDDPKYYKGSALQRRLKEREKEMEIDERDRQREKEEIDEIRRRLAEEGHPDLETEMARIEKEKDEHLMPRLVHPPTPEYQEPEEEEPPQLPPQPPQPPLEEHGDGDDVIKHQQQQQPEEEEGPGEEEEMEQERSPEERERRRTPAPSEDDEPYVENRHVNGHREQYRERDRDHREHHQHREMVVEEEVVHSRTPSPSQRSMSSPDSDNESDSRLAISVQSDEDNSQSQIFEGPEREHDRRQANRGFSGQLEGSESPEPETHKRKKLTVSEAFNQDDEDASESSKKRKLIPLDYSDDEREKPPAKQVIVKPVTAEEKRKCIKNLIEKIPTAKDELFLYTLDWNMVDSNLMDRRIKPWVNKKIVEYIGEEEPTLTDFICQKVMQNSTPQTILDDVAMVLDEEAEVFVVKMWRLLIYETEAKKLGLVK